MAVGDAGGNRPGADETLDASPAAPIGRRPGAASARGDRSRLPETLAVNQARPRRPGAISPRSVPATLTGLVLRRIRPSRARASFQQSASAAGAPSRPAVPIAALIIASVAVLVLVIALGALAIHLLAKPAAKPRGPERVTRLVVGPSIEAARSDEAGASSSLPLTTAQFFACAEYRDAPEDALYTFELTPGLEREFNRSAVLGHGTLAGSAGANLGCTVVRLDSGGPPQPGMYTLWLLREMPGASPSILAHIAISVP